MNEWQKLAFFLRQRADIYAHSGRSNYPGHVDDAQELAEAVVRDEFLELARFIERFGPAVNNLAMARAYAELKKKQDK
jgi:hypothetical protein